MPSDSNKLNYVTDDSNIDELWSAYKTDCNKYYNDEEDKIRFELFKKTVKKVVDHNKKCKTNQVCYPLRINRFADRKPEELQPAQPDELKLDFVTDDSNIDELWSIFKKGYERSYDAEEDKVRFEIFKTTVKQLIEHNQKCLTGENCYSLRINQFADQRPEERTDIRSSGDADKVILDTITSDSNVDELWEAYKRVYNRNFSSAEEPIRRKLFDDTVKYIINHNQKYPWYKVKPNNLSDRKPEEIPRCD